jgi:hypothetical protein
MLWGYFRLEDGKKLICSGFRDFIFYPKCLPTPQQSFIRHPGAIFLTPSSPQILKSIFSHLPVLLSPPYLHKKRSGPAQQQATFSFDPF